MSKPVQSKAWVLIAAAGLGYRMESDIPKQYISLQNYPVLLHTISQFLSHPQVSGVMVVIAEDDPYWMRFFKTLKKTTNSSDANPKLDFCFGGAQRANSVLAGLEKLQGRVENNDWVLVHDAARPGIKKSDLSNLFEQMNIPSNDADGYILAIQSNDTLKRVNQQGQVESTIDRKNIWQVQTPQAFKFLPLKDNLHNQLSEAIEAGLVTDESSVMETAGYKIQVVQGSRGNFKITEKSDIQEMDLELKNQIKRGERSEPALFFNHQEEFEESPR